MQSYLITSLDLLGDADELLFEVVFAAGVDHLLLDFGTFWTPGK